MFPLSFLRVHVSVYIKFDKERHQAVNRKPVVNNKQYVSGFDNKNERKETGANHEKNDSITRNCKTMVFILVAKKLMQRQTERTRERE